MSFFIAGNVLQHLYTILRMRFYQLQQSMDTMVCLLMKGGIKRLQQSKIFHGVEGKAEIEPLLQPIGHGKQANTKLRGVCIEIYGDSARCRVSLAWQQQHDAKRRS